MKNLQKQHPNDRLIIQISDTHLMDRIDEPFVSINPELSFHAVIEDISSRYQEIDAIVHTGDLAQVARVETYDRYLNYMQNLGIPFYQIPGNHDLVDIFPFESPNPIPTLLSFDEWKVILLNSAVPNRIDGWIQSEQLKLLKEVLENNVQHPIILACHHHPLEMKSNWIDRHILKNTNELTEILKPFDNIKAVICGHVHQDSNNIWNNIHFLSTPSTSVQFKPKSADFALDDIAPGYRCLLLKADGSFETVVHRLQNFQQNINQDISGY